MHTKRLYAVKAVDVDDARLLVEGELINDSRVDENNYFFVNGVIDVKNNTYTTIDTDREWKELKSVDGVIKFVNGLYNKERYDKIVEQLKLNTEKQNWFDVELLASKLDDMSNIINSTKDGFTLNDQYVTELAMGKIDTFGIDNWYETTEHNEDDRSYLVVVDFHF